MSSLPKYKYLLTYRYSEIIQDLTVEFCSSHLRNLGNLSSLPYFRTQDQMIQAARSGKQNIVEAVGQSATSKKGEIKLLGVAKASLEELLMDYEDFLRQKKLPIWPKTDPRVMRFRQTAFRLTHLSNLSGLGYLIEKPELPNHPEEAANFLLTLCHQATYLLDRQIKKMEELFIKRGGLTEKLYTSRVNYRRGDGS